MTTARTPATTATATATCRRGARQLHAHRDATVPRIPVTPRRA
ncbi:hypothetical protein ACFQ6N_13820 [Kitasatospora sp. NPDC056446]